MADGVKFRGVEWHKPRGRWRARIKIGATQLLLGYFESSSEAAQAYDVAARSIGRKTNFIEPAPEAIVRKVRPKLVALRVQAKLDSELQSVDPQIWCHGATEGIYWAQTSQKEAIPVDAVNMNDPVHLAESLGVLAIYDENVQKYRSRAKRLVWVRAFLSAAKDVWESPVQPGRQSEPEHLQDLLTRLQAKPSGHVGDVDSGGVVPGTLPQPNGDVWSADCNPTTLAEANAATADAKKNRTGIFAMMDAIDRKRAERRAAEVEQLLADIL